MAVRVSVIVPVYNKAKYLMQLFSSLQSQTLKDFECLIIDDGSTDASNDICDSIAEEDSRFIVYHLSNGGVSRARNYALDRASGEYITFVDGDDYLASDYLESLYRAAVLTHQDMVLSGLTKFWDDSDRKQLVLPRRNGVFLWNDILPEFVEEQQKTGIYGYISGKLIKRELVSSIRFDESLRLAEDLDFYIRLYNLVDGIQFVPHAGYYYRQLAENSTEGDLNVDYYSQLEVQNRLAGFIQSRNSFFGENRTLMTKRLYDYAYFTLFYSDLELTRAYCEKIRRLQLPECDDLASRDIKSRIILDGFLRKKDWQIVLFLRCYRLARRIVRGR